MIPVNPNEATASGVARLGSQPIAVAAAALVIIVLGIGSIALWRGYTGTSPELERVASARQLQTRTAQVSEQLVEKTKGLESTQQESIDQLQVVQDQLLSVRRLLSAQQGETKRLSEQVATLTGAIDSLRESFASAQATETPAPAARPARSKSGRTKSAYRKPGKSRG